MPVIRSNSATLIYGDSGSGKSSLLGTYIQWVWKKHKKITLLYVADGGGWPTNIEVLIQQGKVWVWKMRTRGEAFESCARAAAGWWPETWDPQTGETSLGCKLIKPVTQTFTLYCTNEHIVKTTNTRKGFSAAIKCPKCQVTTNLRNGTIKEEVSRTPGFENVGAVCYDGLTSMQGWIMQDMASRMARGEIVGEKDALGGRIESGEVKRGGNNRAHYGFAQKEAEDWILKTTAIPGLVAPPVWTALELRATDTDSKLPIYGPQIAGKAKTSEVPSWVGNCLGTRIDTNEKGKQKWILHLTEWRDDDNIPHLCKTRAAPATMPPDLQDEEDPEGNSISFTGFNLGAFFDLLDAAAVKAEETMRDETSPGLPSGKVGVGTTREVKPNGEDVETTTVAKASPSNRPGVRNVSGQRRGTTPGRPGGRR